MVVGGICNSTLLSNQFVIGEDIQIPHWNIVDTKVNYKFTKKERRNWIHDSKQVWLSSANPSVTKPQPILPYS
jgi:hypothetical protein